MHFEGICARLGALHVSAKDTAIRSSAQQRQLVLDTLLPSVEQALVTSAGEHVRAVQRVSRATHSTVDTWLATDRTFALVALVSHQQQLVQQPLDDSNLVEQVATSIRPTLVLLLSRGRWTLIASNLLLAKCE